MLQLVPLHATQMTFAGTVRRLHILNKDKVAFCLLVLLTDAEKRSVSADHIKDMSKTEMRARRLQALHESIVQYFRPLFEAALRK